MQFKSSDSAKQFPNLTEELKQLVTEALAARAYRAAYNNKPEVKDKRKAYMQRRNAEINAALQLLKQQQK